MVAAVTLSSLECETLALDPFFAAVLLLTSWCLYYSIYVKTKYYLLDISGPVSYII